MWKKWRILVLVTVLLITGIGWPLPKEAPEKGKAAETYMVYFDSQGGSPVDPVVNLSYGSYLSSLPTPVREGYIFRGWYTDTNYTDSFGTYTYITDNMVVFAKWEEIEISYIEASYQDKVAVVDSLLDKTKVIVKAHYSHNNSTKILKPEEFEIEDAKVYNLGYNYFTVRAGDSYDSFTVQGINEPVYSVSFYSNGGSYVPSITGIKTDQTISLPAEPYREGYEFQGWFLDNGTFKNEFTKEYKIKKSLIVFAKWEKLEVIVEKPVYELNAIELELKINAQKSLYIESYDPYLEVEYFSSNEGVATVNSEGVVEGKGIGTTTVYVITPDGDMLECDVVVEGTMAKSIKLNDTAKRLRAGQTFQIKTAFSPSKVSSKKLKYSSTNSKIARVSSSGKITALKKGVCYISVKTTDGSRLTKKIKIRVI